MDVHEFGRMLQKNHAQLPFFLQHQLHAKNQIIGAHTKVLSFLGWIAMEQVYWTGYVLMTPEIEER
jgi:hypothetical protein